MCACVLARACTHVLVMLLLVLVLVIVVVPEKENHVQRNRGNMKFTVDYLVHWGIFSEIKNSLI